MARIVMKFGGTSVGDIARIRNVAAHVKREFNAGHDVAVVFAVLCHHRARAKAPQFSFDLVRRRLKANWARACAR